MTHAYTPHELARAAGYLIRRVPVGGAVGREYPFGRVLELGPDATDEEIVRIASAHLIMPRMTPALAKAERPRTNLARRDNAAL
jgi:hypothetical protein